MSRYLQAIDWKALFVGLFGWYILPMLLGFVLASWIYFVQGQKDIESGFSLTLAFGLLWWWVLAPVGCGYVVSRIAKQLPQFNAFLAVVLGFAIQSARVTYAVWWVAPVWALLSIAGGAFGAYLATVRKQRRS